MIGKQFGYLTVLNKGLCKSGRLGWKCLCICGNTKVSREIDLSTGNIKSCGCKQHSHGNTPGRPVTKSRDLTNKRFGILVALEHRRIDSRHWWYCKCDCGKFHTIRIDKLESGSTKSCGCQAGPKPSQPNPELTDKSYRHTTHMRAWRNKVLERNNYTCQKCGNKRNLEAHHILGFSKNKELVYEVSNGVTLCEKCHTKFHYYYGNYDFNREDLTRYLSSTS